jgi:phosphoribosylformylglycinamidine synthase
VGNLNIPEHPLPWETKDQEYASTLATPLDIMLDASNGASDYGNKYGEPVICGFARSFGQRLPNQERVEWIKPIMFTAGVGWLDDRHTKKGDPIEGMIICKIGGPAYRIGMGGGAASSRSSADDEAMSLLDFNAGVYICICVYKYVCFIYGRMYIWTVYTHIHIHICDDDLMPLLDFNADMQICI